MPLEPVEGDVARPVVGLEVEDRRATNGGLEAVGLADRPRRQIAAVADPEDPRPPRSRVERDAAGDENREHDGDAASISPRDERRKKRSRAALPTRTR